VKAEVLPRNVKPRNAARVAVKPAPLHAKSARLNKCALAPSSKQFMDFLVLSHLRWDFVYQRPQHLLSRCARQHRVFFWEEPLYEDGIAPMVEMSSRTDGPLVAVPHLPRNLSESENFAAQRALLDGFLAENQIHDFVLWYYTPWARHFSRHLQPAATVYDCMDELSAFRGAPPGLTSAEAELYDVADLVFTGGQSLYESKRTRHRSVHLFPSSIDAAHFAKARLQKTDPADQAAIPHPRIGYCGVIDERMDLNLLAAVADMRPDYHFVLVGPVVKISEEDLPKRANLHYLGAKSYKELPSYLAGWDIAMMPFAINESTRFISPTKTPEYLAAGCPVVSTAITDVVRPYGNLGLVSIAATPADFISAVQQWLSPRTADDEAARLRTVDAFLARSSWDKTWTEMRKLILDVVISKSAPANEHHALTADITASAD
jgi:glycosyltransferase involved in cell wall biosynthesis